MAGAVDQNAFEQVFKDNMSPAGVAALIATLEPTTLRRSPDRDDQRQVQDQLGWLYETLLEMLGEDEYGHWLRELDL